MEALDVTEYAREGAKWFVTAVLGVSPRDVGRPIASHLRSEGMVDALKLARGRRQHSACATVAQWLPQRPGYQQCVSAASGRRELMRLHGHLDLRNVAQGIIHLKRQLAHLLRSTFAGQLIRSAPLNDSSALPTAPTAGRAIRHNTTVLFL
jgi:hypothetical protein